MLNVSAHLVRYEIYRIFNRNPDKINMEECLMKLKNLRYLDLFTVFNLSDDESKGRCAMLTSGIISTMVSY